ncbi:HPP family protein [Halobaculum magnesiiphilum]|uniref:HPP family protein n=1 Tax=Halobaculum magnesiiphilum TaxID=1017351 RepID=A0A8T8WHC2_9EURY|nr:HPP family protein [Halobaculum magnesiiphilum]QZP39251.1 HPP family protein [Halobaculum magnesiiphilum]
MLDSIRYRYHSVRRRIRRIERREVRDLRRWLEDTENLLHLSALVIVPLLIGVVTWLSNVSPVVSFLVYPPLASGTYTLFADPEGRYSTSRKFVGGMTAGAVCGWIALEVSARFWYPATPEQFQVQAGAAVLGIFLTGIMTWGLSLEEPTAFSTALLVLLTGAEQVTYVVGIAVSSLLVAGVFLVWRRNFYRERARYLFRSTQNDDQILVPVRGDAAESVVLFAARLASAHDAGKVVLMKTVSSETIEETAAAIEDADREVISEDREESSEPVTEVAEERLTEEQLHDLEQLQDRITSVVDVPCEFVVAVEDGSAGETVLATADAENCDLIVSPYEIEEGEPSPFVRTILNGTTDAVVFRSSNGRTEWERIMVMVRASGELANAMLDFAHRVVPTDGRISACTCVSRQRDRRMAEITLENLIESFPDPIETRIATSSIEEFLQRNASLYDLTVIGASTDRGAVSRFVSTPTFERIQAVDCDLAIVHRG